MAALTPRGRRARAAAALAAWLLAVGGAAAASADPPAGSPGEGRSWGEVKCARYDRAWTEALARIGQAGLGPDFLARHAAFLASGCTGVHDVCPRSEAEFRLANIMVVLAMNAGTASTFPPFGCPR